MTQFPFRAEARFRTVFHEGMRAEPIGAGQLSYSDPEFAERRWELALEELTDAEWEELEQLFVQCGGMARGFTFLDPTENLLAWSEAFEQEVGVKRGFGVTPGVSDPAGGSGGATLTSGGGGGAVTQSVATPGGYRYAGCIWARTGSPNVAVRAHDGAGASAATALVGDSVWRRYEVGYSGAGAGEVMQFEIAATGTASVDVFGPQLEAQRTASMYKRSGGQSGVFRNARFDQVALNDRSQGPNRHSTTVRIIWTPSLA